MWLVLTVMAVATARADEQPVPLTDAPGREVVEHNCASCHSLDYLRSNSPFLDRRGWQTGMTKMTNVSPTRLPIISRRTRGSAVDTDFYLSPAQHPHTSARELADPEPRGPRLKIEVS